MMITLKPIIDHDSYHQLIEEMIKSYLYQVIYKPILEIANSPLSKLLENSRNDLIKDIRSGKIVYKDGFFTGDFNSAIGLQMRKLGAKFNHLRRAYAIDRSTLPLDIKNAINEGTQLIQERVTEIYKKIEDLRKNTKVKFISFDKPVSYIIKNLDRQFSSTIINPMKKDISIPMSMSPYVKQAIVKDYTKNLNLDINDWYDTAIIRLRQKVHKNVEEGYRASNLIPIIQSEKNVSYRKAKFLATQETSLLVSKYRENRYVEAGIRKYKWSTSNDERVRPDHKKLNNHIYSFNNPPETNSRTKAVNNPGEDYNCRCIAIPILPSEE